VIDRTSPNGSFPTTWRVAGSYFEACSCDAICPCRSVGGRPGGRSTYGICQFALSWHIKDGCADDVVLDGLDVVLAGWYDDDERGTRWRIVLYVDDRADAAQCDALTAIYLGRAGGSTLRQFAAAIGTVHEVRSARITLSNEPRRWSIRASTYVTVAATNAVDSAESISCGIPGHDRPGTEVVADQITVADTALRWDLRERCGFATDFDYTSAA
jgi:hypothetical protein